MDEHEKDGLRTLLRQWRLYAKDTRAEHAGTELQKLAEAHAQRAECCAENIEELFPELATPLT